MNIYFNPITLITLGASLVTISSGEDSIITLTNSYNSDYNTELRCGGTIHGYTGNITYKISEPLQPNERCVWTIRASNTNSYFLYVSSLGLPGSLIISNFGIRGVQNDWIPQETGPLTITNSNVLVVTFYTDDITDYENDNATGFRLDFAAQSWCDSPFPNIRSSDKIIPVDSGSIKHPAGFHNYENNELSTFIYTPVNNYWSEGSKLNLMFQELGMEANADKLSVYVLDPNSTYHGKWSYLGSITGGLGPRAIKTTDVTIIVFETDFNAVGPGFYLINSESLCN